MSDTVATVLVVDDEPGVAYLQCRSLERAGYHVLVAGTPAEALAHVASGTVDLIVLDYCLSDGRTGLQFYSDLKATGCDLAVMIVTGFSAESTVIEALRAGVRDFITKTPDYLDHLPHAAGRVLQQVQLERRLAESEGRFQAFMDHSPALAFIKDEEGRMIYANRACEAQLAGMEWQGRTDRELWPTETAQRLRKNDLHALSTGVAYQTVETIPLADGKITHWLVHKFPVRDPSGRLLLGAMAVDISGRKEAEEALRQKDEQLRQSQKMEAVGTLAGGVAHEFNNLLQAIKGYTAYAMEGLDAADQRHQDLQQVLIAAERAAGLTRQLLGFGRRQALDRSCISAKDVVVDLVKMIRPLIPASIELEVLLNDDSGSIDADGGQLQQVLLNLCLNARDAMPEGGKLLIKTQDETVTASVVDQGIEINPGNYVVFTLSDTGCGMTAEVRQRVFEPFFTTKEVGKGTGLGLAVAYSIVQQHGGTMHVYSEVGQGTQFKIYLPRSSASSIEDASLETPVAPRGNELVLVADDEPLVRDLAVRMLRSSGYTAITAQNGEEAVGLFTMHADQVALVLLDVVMPRMGGHEAYRQIQQIKADVPVVFCSGYDPETAQLGSLASGGFRLLQKPFDSHVLLQTIREALDQVPLCVPG